jgi:hypothetical protein
MRMQRITEEDTYIHVPATPAVMTADGLHLDPRKLVAEAIRIAAATQSWTITSQEIQPHQIQQPEPR